MTAQQLIERIVDRCNELEVSTEDVNVMLDVGGRWTGIRNVTFYDDAFGIFIQSED